MPSPIHNIIFERMEIPRLKTALDLTVTRQKLLTENVANAETPGYRRKDINFQSELRQAVNAGSPSEMKATRAKHIGAQDGIRTPNVTREDVERGEVSSVDIDQEMAKVAQNQIEYNIAAQLVKGRFDGLRTVIRGRR